MTGHRCSVGDNKYTVKLSQGVIMRLNPVNLITNTDQYFGKNITRITDNEGNDLFDLHMQDSIIFIFSDGDKLSLALDWYGQDCYISQKTTD